MSTGLDYGLHQLRAVSDHHQHHPTEAPPDGTIARFGVFTHALAAGAWAELRGAPPGSLLNPTFECR